MIPVVRTLIELLKIESFTKMEGEICRAVENKAKEFCPKDSGCSVKRFGDSLAVIGPVLSDRKTVTLCGHLDTVPGTDTGDKVRVDGDRVIGLGASDMKGGLAVMLELLRERIWEKSRFNLIWIFYAGEEGPHSGNKITEVKASVPEVMKSNLTFFLEPTDNTLHLGCMGSIHAVVTFTGKRAHSARPWEGENAILKGAPFLSRLRELKPVERNVEGLIFKEVMSPTLVNSGVAKNVIPEVFTVNLNVRYAPGVSSMEAKKRVTDLVRGEGDVEFTDVSPAGMPARENEIVREFIDRFSLPVNPKQAYTDVAVFSEWGLDAVNFGPGLPSQAHQVGEYIPIDNLTRNLECLRSFLA